MLSCKGLPTAGSVGYEIFDNASAAGPDRLRPAAQPPARPGRRARPHHPRAATASPPPASTWCCPSASCSRTRPSSRPPRWRSASAAASPAADQVRAMQNLVAGAVPNLKPDRVTVVDQHAKTLSGRRHRHGRPRPTAARARSSSASRKTGQGPGRGHRRRRQGPRATSPPTSTCAHVTIQEEKFDPDGQVVRSDQHHRRELQGEPADGNVRRPSAAANIPGGADAPAPATATSSNQRQAGIHHQLRDLQDHPHRGAASPARSRRSVGGRRRRRRHRARPARRASPAPTAPRSAAEMAQIEQLVRAAVGYDQARGDQVTRGQRPLPHRRRRRGRHRRPAR